MRAIVVLTIAFLSVAGLAMASDIKTGAGVAEKIPACSINVSFDLNGASLSGTEAIDLPEGQYKIYTGGLKITSTSMTTAQVSPVLRKDHIEAYGPGTLNISFQGRFTGAGEALPAEVPGGGVINNDGVELTGLWYPQMDGLATYEMKALVPHEFSAISESDEIQYTDTASGRLYSFRFAHPVGGISLVAAKYQELSTNVDGITVYTYFFPADEDLAQTYLDYAKKYFSMYNRLFVHYPYKRFSVVEGAMPTGLSMPTFTLLGRDVVRLPFIPGTSLGHEIVHQWFGNYVYCNTSEGNWLEAITSYLADHHLAELEGKGWQYRKKIMTDYASYVNPSNEITIAQFRERTSPATMAIGYGKGAMMFHMLRKMKGDKDFYAAVRKLITDNEFRYASWDDVKKAFQSVYKEDLGWFFDQWLYRKGVPGFAVMDGTPLVLHGKPVASFYIDQGEKPYRLSLPATIVTDKGTENTMLQIAAPKQSFQLNAAATPQSVIFDENYDVMRTLAPDELPPLISRLMGAKKKILVYPADKKEQSKYNDFIKYFTGMGFASKSEEQLTDNEIRENTLLVLGNGTAVEKRLFGRAEGRGPGFVIDVRINPIATSRVVAFANASSADDARLAAPKIQHYGQYSWLRFEGGIIREKKAAVSKRGQPLDLSEEIQAVEPARSLGLNQVIKKVSGFPVIFIGERHTNYEDHKVELDVIRALHREGKKIAIGMEMFQVPYQFALDDYIAGKIDERQFLKKSQYFSRWGFDYNQYREIIEYAKANHIPIVALNIRAGIVDKVSRGGLDSLTPKEKKAIPADMDMSNSAYRKRLEDVFYSHPGKLNFHDFYQAQIIWDETMAHSAAAYMAKNPGVQMIILAGAEHVMYSDGIPDRLKRRTGKDYCTIINGEYDKGVGNYVVFAAPMEAPEAPKLGIYTEEKDGGLFVKSVLPDSPAYRAGIKESDRITEVDGWEVSGLNDVKIAMFDKLPGQVVRVRVVRRKFLFGQSTLDLYVTL